MRAALEPRTTPMSFILAAGMAFLAFFVPIPRRAPALVAVEPAIEPVSEPVFEPSPVPETFARPAPEPYVRPVPTPLGLRVLAALDEREPLRKCEVASLVGIGRGSANRIVDRLCEAGWLRQAAEGRYALA